MTTYDLNPRCAAPSGAAQAHSLRSAAARLGRGLENDTPDASPACRADGPQTQHRRGLAATTAASAADHEATTATATH